MKNTRAIVMLVLSLAIGLGAAILAAGWVQQQGGGANKVVVAAVDVDLGTRLNSQMLKTVDWPSGSVPPGSFTDAKDLTDRVVKTSILRGEAIVEPKLAPAGTKGGLSAVIKEGSRAITVRVNDVIGVAGFALPGNYVDIVVSTQEDGSGSSGKQISKIVLEHILVLAVAQEVGRDETKPKVVNAVTLEVTPEQAERLDLARSVGSLSLVLRNQVDPALAHTAGITKVSLLGSGASKAPVIAKEPRSRPVVKKSPLPARDCVEVISGLGRTQECF